MISNQLVHEFIGVKRFREFGLPLENRTISATFTIYKFDTDFRALIMRSISVIEVGLVTQIQNRVGNVQFNSFGSARRALDSLSTQAQYAISVTMGSKNQRELKSFLIHLNHIRNRSAHHERIWNRPNKFALPPLNDSEIEFALGTSRDPSMPAATIFMINQVLNFLPPVFNFLEEFEKLIATPGLDRNFVLENMGFELS